MSLLFNMLSRLVITKVTPIKNKFKNKWWFPISLSSSVIIQKDRGSSLALGGENHGFSSGAWEWQILLSQQQKAIALKDFATSEEGDETLYSSPGSHQPSPLLPHQQELALSSLLPAPSFSHKHPLGTHGKEFANACDRALYLGTPANPHWHGSPNFASNDLLKL